MATTNLNVRIDADLKKQSEEIFNELGLNMSTALTVFLRQTVRSRGIPFEMRLNIPNEETLAAIQDVNMGRNMSRQFHSVKELMEDLDADD
ncbi:MAG: type II toxin-antitoxin system RelB/DinJ family antitoxin [Defluviitaleaceae bacterium]|nr:type II toxin-antitoxin system RelB/DinJ family antitoxin [Defluviitaleaceae bacterium]